MKKRLSQKLILIFFLFILISFLFIPTINLLPLINAQTPGVPDITSINPETGQLETFEKFQDAAEQISKEEKRKEYLKQEWTNLLAENKFLGPILFYTDKGFSFFNPVWKIIFGIEFSYSWFFIFSFIIWITLIILLYYPAKALTNFNLILSFIASVIMASLVGVSGIIRKFADLLTTMVTNLWLVGISIIITVLVLMAYQLIMKSLGKKLKKQTEEEKTKRARKTIQTEGDVAGKELDERGK
ncbi:hypothetical protein HOD75_03415 [archaeon]|jgi:hypothetical protein|nr:hypothetical protein [archaeon]MBT4241922.1 hypothetical protein [archaeon]MBT4418469.1 hypothetical protein [archaeon]